tara:strand:- start:797 stop:1333 length:537 start_codon:yes stop_codon:yes gene_type:complete
MAYSNRIPGSSAWWRDYLLLVVLLLGCVTSARSASFDVIEERTYGDWRAVLYENKSGARRFCAAESEASDGTVFRIAVYLDDRDAFFEIFNPKWNLREAAATFTLVFDDIRAELRGKAYSDAYVYNLVDQEKTQLLLGLLIGNSTVSVQNANGEVASRFSLRGSRDAIGSFAKCSGGL